MNVPKQIPNNSLCYLCRLPGADSRDHLPARAAFYLDRPSDLLTLPAHRSCQAAYAKDEEYAFAFLRRASWEGYLAWMHYWEKVRKNGNHHTAEPRYCEVDIPRVGRVVKKIIQGLHYLHFRESIPPEAVTATQLLRWKGEDRQPAAELLRVQAETIAFQVRGHYQEFKYAFTVPSHRLDLHWLLIFYNLFAFSCVTCVESIVRKNDIYGTDLHLRPGQPRRPNRRTARLDL